ncbi:tRNA (adenosine(37)-N6)-threonylcarbamoyltransferase complex dimerization subunit type 1 TsaB [Flavobacterium sp. J372]|uniref:tRNA (adenosine(37)-N6)-threonylcarbamoyltransferase complex dimerization subunit type 1 TsaB n=1 Tax=Flavobacterium sp. J372 TaxID=2898436 RepID=UPI0021514A04|nr:tRNA (adenosine(37)-N6)-threonylcarbamoyltransferase complex dimerization subunit type 1 TsaB [Flavobacterium sp. J372]MCR5863352.1 tRNA (adenosine(37)-N6)-threonylcarbamoyltransferase complex dimerization subunit type 1 TsaB [Flavobacterium sp. J372]
MAYILNLETATRNCSVSLAKDGKTIALKEYAGEGYTHAEKLHVFIEDVLKEAGVDYKSLNAVAVSMGPGSYTGLRIGVSAAKGLCYALNIPLIAVDTLEVLAHAISPENGSIIPMIDARRMEAYTAAFSHSHTKIRDTEAEIITEDSFAGFDGPLHLVGDGAAKCKALLTANKFIYHDEILFPSAAQMGVLSYAGYKNSDTVDVAYFEPYYLKDFIAGK